MGRLLTFPHNPGLVAITPVSGPNVRNSGSNTAQDGSETTFDSIGDLVALKLDFVLKRGRDARRERGHLTGLQIGGNATRLKFFDPDMMKPAEAGLNVPAHLGWTSLSPQKWAGNRPWAGGKGWKRSAPVASVAQPAAYDTSFVSLANQHWGRSLQCGDYFGFFPLHFGLYTVIAVEGPGEYQIWPRLRKAITPSDFATLFPSIVMRVLNRDAVSMKRGVVHTEGQSVTLVEVIDPYVRKAFAA